MDLPLVTRKWDGDEWPEKRISIADNNGHAVFINARYLPLEEAKKSADQIVLAVNSHYELIKALEDIMGAVKRCEQNENVSLVDEFTEEVESNALKALYNARLLKTSEEVS